jgi:hypothetical protein
VRRLFLEALENRELLATFLWIAPAAAPNKSWEVAANWVDVNTGANGKPGNGDTVIFDRGRQLNIGGMQFEGTGTDSIHEKANLKLHAMTLEGTYSGTVRLDNNLEITYNYQQRAGLVKAQGPSWLKIRAGAFMSWGGGQIDTDVYVGEAGMAKVTTTFSGGRGNRRLEADRTMTMYANTNWTEGDVLLGGGAKIINEEGSQFTVGGGFRGTIGFAAGPGMVPGVPANPAKFINKGTFSSPNGGNTTSFFVDYETSGVTQVLAGDINWMRGFKQTAGTTTLGGLGSIRLGKSPMLITGGTLNGSGIITGDVNNTGGTVSPGVGAAPGTLVVKGDYTQAVGGKLNIRINAAGSASLLDVRNDGAAGGLATLAGTLQVDRNPAYTPPAGTELEVLKAVRTKNTFGNVTINNNNWAVGGMGGLRFQSSPRGTGHKLVVMAGMKAQAATGTTIMASAANPQMGQAVTYTVTVNAPTSGPAPSSALIFAGNLQIGTVTLTASGNPGEYVGQYVTSTLPAGDFPVAAVFDGDEDLAPSESANVLMSVAPESALATSIVLALDREEACIGETVTLTATVSGAGYRTGTVTFYDGEQALGTVEVDINGVARISVLDLPLGLRTLTAVYSGDPFFEGSVSNQVTLLSTDLA